MFGRRMQRMARREMRRGNVPPKLQRANQLMADGDYAGASALFEDLSKGAEEKFPRRAPFLYVQAGYAAILSGQTKIGMEHLKRGLNILISQGRLLRVRRMGQRIVDELNARGLTSEAQEISALLNSNLPQETPARAAAPAKRPILPTHCPSCGAAVRPDEVEWLDDVTAECDYCGSPVR